MLLTHFFRDRRGAVAPIFALALIPMVGLTGAAVDYSRANNVRAGMQAAVDATALAMAKLAPTLTPGELQTKTNAYFQALFNHPDAKNIVISPSYTTQGGSQLTIAVSSTVDTTFMNVLGISSMSLGTTSTVKWGNQRLRVALALDNTGSMASAGKIEALRTATNSLLSQLKDAAKTNGDVYVSIIPFAKDVNVGANNKGASWIDWTDWNNNNGTCTKGNHATSSTTKSACEQENGNPDWYTASHDTWNGCVTDRGTSTTPTGQGYDTNANAPNNTVSSKFPAEQFVPCPQPVMALSYNWPAMTTLVNNMSPGGNTNQGIGLAHAWMSLKGGGPYPTPPAKDPQYQYSDVIILLTDGLNTQNRWFADQASIDARQKITCDNVNAANITLYTIQVNTDGDPVSTLLQNCAGTAPSSDTARVYPDPSKSFVVTSSSGIGTVFNQIASKLSKLRISN